MVALLPALGTAATVLGLAPLAGPAIDLATGETQYQAREKALSRGPEASGDFRTTWFENVLGVDQDSLRPEYDKRQQQSLLKDDQIVKMVAAGMPEPLVGQDKAGYLRAHGKNYADTVLQQKITDAGIVADAQFGSKQNEYLREVADETRNYNRYLQETKLIQDQRDRDDKIEARKIARDDKLLARQQSFDLGMAQLNQLKAQDTQNYNLALQKMERDSKLAHQQKIASIIGGIGNVGMMLAA